MLSQEENDLLTRTGPDTPGGALLRRYWQPVALAEELPANGAPLPVRIMYASDYPHGDSKWPETVSRIRNAGFSNETQNRILGENAARLYNIQIPLG